MGSNPAKTSELRQIRCALGLKQAEMMDLLALSKAAQNTLSGYETNPKKKGYEEALARAKEVYKARTGEEWKTPGATDERELGKLEGALVAHILNWEKGEEKVLKRVRALGRRLVELERRAGIGPYPQEDEGWL